MHMQLVSNRRFPIVRSKLDLSRQSLLWFPIPGSDSNSIPRLGVHVAAVLIKKSKPERFKSFIEVNLVKSSRSHLRPHPPNFRTQDPPPHRPVLRTARCHYRHLFWTPQQGMHSWPTHLLNSLNYYWACNQNEGNFSMAIGSKTCKLKLILKYIQSICLHPKYE